MLIDNRTLQTYLKSQGTYTGKIDGLIGPLSNAAIKQLLVSRGVSTTVVNSSNSRRLIAASQLFLQDQDIEVGKIDGLVGPQTRYAVEEWVRKSRNIELSDDEVSHQATVWPRQSGVPAFFGERGANQVMLELPYPMKIAWEPKTIVYRISIHKKVAESAGRALARIHSVYGNKKPAGLDLFGGALNVRKMRGGSAWSMHSWGIAIDFDPDHNQLSWGRDRARFARAEYEPFWQAWEAEGWISLGREKNYDWMHVQAARL